AGGAAAPAAAPPAGGAPPGAGGGPAAAAGRHWPAGSDVRHALYGPGWVQGSGVGRVTVRFEQPGSPPGRVRTFRVDDLELESSDPLPLVGRAEGEA
ncbi:DNA polymerase IV, partial [Streptomyces lavendulae]